MPRALVCTCWWTCYIPSRCRSSAETMAMFAHRSTPRRTLPYLVVAVVVSLPLSFHCHAGHCCSENIKVFRRSIGAMILRSDDAP